MAKYVVTHSCGHDQTHVMFGKLKKRDEKAEYLAEGPCTDCWKKEQDADPPTPLFFWRPIPGGSSEEGGLRAEIVCYHGGYHERSVLRESGYRYSDCVSMPQFDLSLQDTLRGHKGWIYTIEHPTHEEVIEEIKKQIEWINEAGWKIYSPNLRSQLLSGLVEGRPELLPAI